MLSNQELQSAHVEHFGMIHYDYVYTQVQEGSKFLIDSALPWHEDNLNV